MATPETHPWRLSFAPTKEQGSHAEALVDSRAVPTNKSKSFCCELDVEVEQGPVGFSVGDEELARSFLAQLKEQSNSSLLLIIGTQLRAYV